MTHVKGMAPAMITTPWQLGGRTVNAAVSSVAVVPVVPIFMLVMAMAMTMTLAVTMVAVAVTVGVVVVTSAQQKTGKH